MPEAVIAAFIMALINRIAAARSFGNLMSKFVLFVIIVMLVLWAFKVPQRWSRSHAGRARHSGHRMPAAETMVRCAQCGVYVPQSEGVVARGRTFCSQEHRKHYLSES